jgi:hypothetical protein
MTRRDPPIDERTPGVTQRWQSARKPSLAARTRTRGAARRASNQSRASRAGADRGLERIVWALFNRFRGIWAQAAPAFVTLARERRREPRRKR